MEVALVIPCFNEASRLTATFRLIEEFFAAASQHEVTIIFVDDGSTDSTRALLTKFVEQPHKDFKTQLVIHECNHGKGAAIISGWKSVEADAYGFSDADLSFGLKALWPTVHALQNYDVVIAKRFDQESEYSRVRHWASRFMRLIARQLTGVKATHPQSGWKFMTRQTLKKILPRLTQTRFAFDLELLLLLQADHARIHESVPPFTHHPGSSVKTRDGLRYLTDALAISDSLPLNHGRFVWQLAFVTTVVSFALYGWIIHYGSFFSDDFTGLWYGKQIVEGVHNILSLHAATFFSPVINIYYWVGFGIFGASDPVFLAANILIHAVVAVMVGLLAWELSGSRLNAWCAALLVAIAGSAYEAIVWIAANMHSLATLWIVSALYASVRFYKTQRWSFVFASLLFQILAYGTKEISIVVFPLLCIALWSVWRQKTLSFTRRLSIFVVSSGLLWIGYAILQFMMQRGGETFAENNYSISWQGLDRIPFALLDLFAPLQAIDHLLTPISAALIGLSVLGLGSYFLKKYWTQPLVPLAFSICLLGIMPTIFFTVTSWWEPLASRYTYLPHVGAALLIASILVHSVKHNSRRVIHALTAILVVVSLSQLAFMIQAVTTQYAYVYKTGSTLAYAAGLLNPDVTPLVYVHPDHPFPGNTSHIIGALNVYADYQPEQVIFLSPGERADLSPAHMLLYWHPEHRQYELTSHDSIFDELVP